MTFLAKKCNNIRYQKKFTMTSYISKMAAKEKFIGYFQNTILAVCVANKLCFQLKETMTNILQ